MVLGWKRVVCPLRVGTDVLPQVEEFRYLWISGSEGTQSMYGTVMAKRELGRNAKL